MKNKAPLNAMEQLIMVLIFAISAAVCIQIMALSDKISEDNSHKTYAMERTVSVAEQLKLNSGDIPADVIYYDSNWQETNAPDIAYTLTVERAETAAFLGQADITVTDADGEVIYTLPAAWQED